MLLKLIHLILGFPFTETELSQRPDIGRRGIDKIFFRAFFAVVVAPRLVVAILALGAAFIVCGVFIFALIAVVQSWPVTIGSLWARFASVCSCISIGSLTLWTNGAATGWNVGILSHIARLAVISSLIRLIISAVALVASLVLRMFWIFPELQ